MTSSYEPRVLVDGLAYAESADPIAGRRSC
jgi:hypothetical protein